MHRRGRHAGDGVGLQRLAHRRVGGRLPGPLHPARRRCRRGTREAMCAEIRRVAAKGCRAVTMPELPHLEGLPSYHDDEYWGPVFRTLSEENVVMCLHIGTGFGAISMAPERADRQPDHPGHPGVGDVRPGSAVGPGDAQLPGSEVRVLRGRHRLDPVLPRPQRPALHQPEVAAAATSATSCPATCSASTRWPATSPTRRR